MWITTAAVAAISLTVFAMAPAHADSPAGERFRMAHGGGSEKAGGNKGTVNNLIDHGGPVLPAANIYAIYWGPTANFPADAQTGMTKFLAGFGASNYLQIAKQYMRGSSITATYKGAYFDTSAPTSKSPSTSGLAVEIQKVLTANSLTADPNGIYVVFSSDAPNGGGFCAWHNGATVGGTSVAEAYLPNPTSILAGCGTPADFDGTGYSAATRSLADSTAHELMESITDQSPGGKTTAWVDKGGAEVADKCEFVYGGPVRIGGLNWEVQEEWSNAVSACVQYSS
jgi:hypothetical protein